MKKSLQIVNSPRLEKSNSEAVATESFRKYIQMNPSAQTDTPDLWEDRKIAEKYFA